MAKPSHHQAVADLLPPPEPAPLPADVSPKEKLAHRLHTNAGRTLYKLRKQTVEPVFGNIKTGLRDRQFLLRDREKVSREWRLPGVSCNCKRLVTLKNLAPVG